LPLGGELTQKRFAELTGVPKSTVHDWFYGRLVDQIRGLLCCLERLNLSQRAALLQQICRDCPRIDDPRLAHDQQTVTVLKALVRQPCGLTLIGGRPEGARTFLVTAMGNSAAGWLQACGLDVRPPEFFVPVSGVFYLDASHRPMDRSAIVHALWPVILSCRAQLLILNGVWNSVPELHPKIIAAARSRNVIIADGFGPEQWNQWQWPGLRLTRASVSQSHSDNNRFIVQFGSGGPLT
jgi:hypothetical protein